MPVLIPVVVGAIAAIAAAAPAVGSLLGLAAGVSLAGAIGSAIGVGAALIAGTIGTLVATATSLLVTSLSSKPKARSAATSGGSSVAAAAQDQKIMVRSTVEARRVVYGRARVSGPILYSCSSGADLRYLHLVIALAGHRLAGIDEVWLDDQIITAAMIDPDGRVNAGKYAGRVYVIRYLGDQTQADPYLLTQSPDGWAVSDILTGIAYIHVRFEYDRDVFSGGLPNVSAVVRGKADIWDPRDGNVGYSENWALCVLDYLRAEFGMRCAADELHIESFKSAANLSDEAVPINGAGTETEPRYTVNGSFKLDETPNDIIEKLIGAGAGALPYVAGQYRLYGGAYTPPYRTIGDADFAGSLEVVTRPPAGETFNCVRGTFVDPARQWQAGEFPPLKDFGAISLDGEESWKDVEFPFVIGAARAQRLALQLYYRTRAPMTFRAPLKHGVGLTLAIWDVVAVTQQNLGWANKPFRLTQWNLDPISGEITGEFQEELPSAYAWTWDLAKPVPDAPRTTLANAFTRPPAPGGLGFQESLYVTRDGAGVRTQIGVSWLPVANAFVRDFEVQYRAEDDAAWRAAPTPLDGTSVVIEDLAAGTYIVRVRARTGQANSDWSELRAVVGGLAAVPPSTITGLAAQSIGGLAFLRWDQHPDLDVRVGGRIEFRHTPETVTPSWAGATSIGEAIPGNATTTILPLKPGTYLAKAVDAGGRYADAAASITTAQATALAFASVASVAEHPGFAGTRTGTVVVSSSLRLDSGAAVDAAPSWDAINPFDGSGGVLASGTYQFAAGIDLGTVQRVRLTPRLMAQVMNTLDAFDARTAPVDTWLGWDGVVGGEADAWVEVRETPDNPAGTPAWSAWKRLDQGEFVNRAFQFRVQLRSRDPAFNIHITELSVAADKV